MASLYRSVRLMENRHAHYASSFHLGVTTSTEEKRRSLPWVLPLRGGYGGNAGKQPKNRNSSSCSTVEFVLPEPVDPVDPIDPVDPSSEKVQEANKSSIASTVESTYASTAEMTTIVDPSSEQVQEGNKSSIASTTESNNASTAAMTTATVPTTEISKASAENTTRQTTISALDIRRVNRSKSRQVAIQGACYTLAFLLVHVLFLAHTIRKTWVGKTEDNMMLSIFAFAIMLPSQGFFNCLVFVRQRRMITWEGRLFRRCVCLCWEGISEETRSEARSSRRRSTS
jgi:hypothetical protein